MELLTKLNINYFELFRSQVYQIENLEKSRKRYPMTDAVYFIRACAESVNQVKFDFREDDKLDFDQYGNVHVVFSGPCPDSLLESLCDSPKLAERITTVLEANVDFALFEDNVFTTGNQQAAAGSAQYESLAFSEMQT